MLAFDKADGVLVASDRWSKGQPSLMDAVQAKWGAEVANVHRLDADTSGVVLCAKTKPALDFLSGQFQSKTVDKRFVAVVALLPLDRRMKLTVPGVERGPDDALPDVFTINLALGDDEARPGRMRVFGKRGGKPAETVVTVLERFGGFALVQCQLSTGRTHQVRLHLAAAGAPVVNDALYGDPEVRLLLSNLKRGYKGRADEKPLIDRLALHASELTVKHPVTREPVTIRSALPHEFEIALKYLRKFPGRPTGSRSR